MKNWSTTKKILVALGVIILVALIYKGFVNYKKASREAEAKRMANRIAIAAQQKASDSMTGEQLTAAIRNNLSKQPVSEIGVKFYQPQY